MIIENRNHYKIDACSIRIDWRIVQKKGILNRSSINQQEIQILPVVMPTGGDYRIPWHNMVDSLVMGDTYSETWGSSIMPTFNMYDEETGVYSAEYRIGFSMLPKDVYYILFALNVLSQEKKTKFKIVDISISVSAPDSPTSGYKEIIKCYSKDAIVIDSSDDSDMAGFIGWLSRENNNWSLNIGTLPEFAKGGKKLGGTVTLYLGDKD